MKRIRFTKDELQLIQAAVTMANGDYDDDFLPNWTAQKANLVDDSVHNKLYLLLERVGKKKK